MVRRSPDAHWRQCLDGVIVLPPLADGPVFFAHPADLIWALLDEELSLADVCSRLRECFGTTDPAIEEQTEQFIDELVRLRVATSR